MSLRSLLFKRTHTTAPTPSLPTPPPDMPFVFIIGFNKTATTSLHYFFEGNGFPGIHWDHNRLAITMMDNCLHDRKILTGYDQHYRVFSDMIAQTLRIRLEANHLFRILDTDYPGAFFIYNNRPMEAWLNSRWNKPCGKYKCTNVELEMKLLNTRNPQDVLDTWQRERLAFEQEVRAYFAGNHRFLDLDITDPDVPGKIAAFLGRQLDPAHWGHIRTNSVITDSERKGESKVKGP
ncbi:MAG TPA: hypothetical protein PJ991_04205 [Kiritimatiellia bacterium]|nr:hypothetical protein [Kiritimatiellia bacterium]